MDSALSWSHDNKKIERAIMEKGYDKNTTMNVYYIKEQYTELDFTGYGITDIDKDIMNFPNLKVLELSQNKISKLTNLPLTLEECIVAQCGMEKIDPRLSVPSLLYLNVSGNLLDVPHLGSLI
jgi:Leucine-rich repeat (LRR) protein